MVVAMCLIVRVRANHRVKAKAKVKVTVRVRVRVSKRMKWELSQVFKKYRTRTISTEVLRPIV